ncbi:MAG TPA: hypothetical protein DHW76_08355 [Clostridiaceae bacterium]|nr:hypothetical protein [Clostridiaceae bacterium]
MAGDIKTFYFFICLLDREQFIVHFDSPFLIHIITAFLKLIINYHQNLIQIVFDLCYYNIYKRILKIIVDYMQEKIRYMSNIQI